MTGKNCRSAELVVLGSMFNEGTCRSRSLGDLWPAWAWRHVICTVPAVTSVLWLADVLPGRSVPSWQPAMVIELLKRTANSLCQVNCRVIHSLNCRLATWAVSKCPRRAGVGVSLIVIEVSETDKDEIW